MPKGVPNKRYTAEFKKLVIETMQEEKLSYSETCRRFDVNSRDQIKSWELYHIGSSCAQHGDNHAERGICKNSGRNKPHSPF